MTKTPDHCWVIHDGAAGNRKQALALANRLGWSFVEKTVQPSFHARWFAPRLLVLLPFTLGDDFAHALKNPPRFVIGCGRQAALATRILKQHGSVAIQILDPRINPRHWDVIIAPRHDDVRGNHVIHVTGSLHEVDAEALRQWRQQHTSLAEWSSPRTLVLIGGPSRMASFNEGLLEVMFSHLEYDLAKHGGSLIICGSRRTPKLFADKIRQRFSDSDFPIWFDDSDGENIYRPALAHADRIVLTPDSVNMISEACATDLPVYIAQPERARGRMRLFLDQLEKIGRIKKQARELNDYPVTALDTMPGVIEQLKHFFKP